MNTHTATPRLAATLAAALAVSLSACVSTDGSSGNDDGAASGTNNPTSSTSGSSNLSGLSGRQTEDPLLNVWDRYGPWSTDIAQRFAFVKPESEVSLVRNGIVTPATPPPEPHLPTIDNHTEEQLAASKECDKDPQVIEFGEAWMRVATRRGCIVRFSTF